jgi:hypothetical protein
VFASRTDIYAGGDGGALDNNRHLKPFVNSVPMDSQDYTFTVHNPLPPPSTTAQLVTRWTIRRGDSFTAAPIIEVAGTDALRVTIPWKSGKVGDRAIFARTLDTYWNEGNGISTSYRIQPVAVSLDQIHVSRNLDKGNDGEYRVFANIGNDWMFLNDIDTERTPFGPSRPGNILEEGLADTSDDKSFDLGRTFYENVPVTPSVTGVTPLLHIQASGWESDANDDAFGHLINPYSPCTQSFKDEVSDTVFALWSNLFRGCNNDPSVSLTTRGLEGT